MKLKFLVTTAVALSAFGTTQAQSYDAAPVSAAAFAQMLEVVQTTKTVGSFHLGDTQVNARAVAAQHLYRGDGASLMWSIRMHRD